MQNTIQWPEAEFTIQEAFELNPTVPQQMVREELSRATAAKLIAQTQKGDRKIKGKFKVVKSV